MRRLLPSLAALAVCAVLFELPPAGAASASASASRPSASTSAAIASASAGAHRRSWTISLSPAPDQLALAELSFAHARGRRLSRASLLLSARAPFGDDYLVAGAVRGLGRIPRALVLVANRPSALADPAHVSLRASALGVLGAPSILRAADPFTRAAAKPPALCDLPLHGKPLAGSQLVVLATRGAPLSGFGASSALAEAYDALCRLPYSSALKSDLESVGGTPSPAPGESPAPVPSPEPTPTPPGCAPCPRSATAACPEVRKVCVSPPRTGRRRRR